MTDIDKICSMKNHIKKSTDKESVKKVTLKKLGERIRQIRISKGYSSYEYFAYDHNISRAQFGRYERGEDLRFSTLAIIIEAFDMTLEEFFAEGFDNKKIKSRTK
jgi:transcriptional regulator with XRE-family HTH domain